jgi:alkylhydroperoxidase family enzyme
MTRIPPLSPPYEAEIQATFDRIMPPGEPPLMLFRVLARGERAWRKFRAGSLLDRGPLSLRERELVIDRTCARCGCEYEWGVHVMAFATKAGLSAAEIEATVSGPADAACWTAREQSMLGAVDALHERARLTDEEYGRLSRHFDTDQIFEILLLAGFYRTVSYLANGLDLPLEPAAARFPSSP